MTTTEQDLTRRTYDAFMAARKSRDADKARAALRSLREEAESQNLSWDAIRNRAIMFDASRNG